MWQCIKNHPFKVKWCTERIYATIKIEREKPLQLKHELMMKLSSICPNRKVFAKLCIAANTWFWLSFLLLHRRRDREKWHRKTQPVTTIWWEFIFRTINNSNQNDLNGYFAGCSIKMIKYLMIFSVMCLVASIVMWHSLWIGG